MAPELRKTGISVVGDVPWGTHFCTFYETTQDLLDILVPFFKTGLENKEFCLWIISNSELLTIEEAMNALRRVRADLDGDLSQGRIELVHHDQWFLDGDGFDIQRVAHRFEERLNQALAKGYAGMRVNGSPAWLYKSDDKELVKFERRVDELYPDLRIIASCTYPIPKSDAGTLLDVAEAHRFVITRRRGSWEILETPELIQTKAEIQRLNGELEQRVIERTRKLEETTARLRAEIEERKEAEGAVRQSEERFAAFMDNLPGYAWMKDLQGRYVYVNEMVRGLPGYESLGKTDAQIWPADLAAEYRANDKQVIAAKRPLQTLEHYQQEGKQRYMVGSKFPIFDKTGAVALVGGVGVDITERIEAEEALRESEERFRQVAENIREVFWLSTTDFSDILYVSAAYETVWGRTRESLYREPRSFIDAIHSEDRARVVDIIERERERGPFEVEYRVVRPDGSICWIRDRGFPIKDEAGLYYRVAGIAEDITERKQAEEAVREGQQLVRLVLETLPVGVAVVNQAGDIALINAASKRIWGGTIVGGRERWEQTKGYWHDSGQRIAPENWASVRALSKGETSLNELIDIETYDGRRKTIHNSAAPIRNEEGLIVGAVVVNEDITDRVQAEEALRRSEDHLRLVIDTIPVMAWSVGPDGIVDFLNQPWMDYAGLTLERYVADPTGPIHPEDTARVLEKWRAQMAVGEGYEDEMRLRRADGKYRWFLVRTQPLRDEQGNLVKWYGVSIDIEDRKRAEMESRALIDAIPQQIWSGPPDGTNDYVNERWRSETGLGLEEMLGDGWQTLLHPEDRDRVLKAWHYSVLNGRPYEQEERHRRADGTYRWYLSRGLPLRDNEGRIIRWYGTNTDIEDRKQAEEKLKATTEQLRALSASLQSAREQESTRIAREIHDELGGALTSLRWDLEEVGDVVSEAKDLKQVTSLRKRIKAMLTLTETTLDTVRRLASELRPIALDELGLVEAIEWQAKQFETRTGISVRFDCSLERVNLDKEQSTAVFRILQEALTNVLRHAQATKVTIKIRQKVGEFLLTIKDNGTGITESGKWSAHSLGLLGMRERAHLIGAKIEITGREGKGTQVTVSIPLNIPG